MHLKRYRRATVKDALRAAREELGPDALVLSSSVVRASGIRGLFGGREVEIMAAVERLPVSESRLSDGRPDGVRGARGVAARLEAGGMPPEIARLIAGAIPATRRRAVTGDTLRRAAAEQLGALAAAEERFAPVEVFVGPPGAGKTTTIAKIAAQARARRGERVGLLAADGFRVGAVEQLRLYADIVGAPFATARTPAELDHALDSSRCPVLLDTAGRSPGDEASRDMFRALAGRPGVRTHLVLPAGTPPAAARRTLERFADARPSRLAVTKLDETETIAPLLAFIRDSGLALSYLGTGQGVPEDLQRATPAAIAAWALGDEDQIGAVA